jgi:D-alanyl-D-alanine carboxypeptidase/D-alanyl-D-alanine-endopeptidase (penicillin-binding protein 4)
MKEERFNTPFAFIPLFFFFLCVFLQADFVPSELQSIIKQSGMSQKEISIYIKETKSNKLIASLNASKKRNPASVIKLATTYASILELGYGYRWVTDVGYRGTISQGVLRGDLVIKGGGDPNLKDKDVLEIAQHIRDKGIKRIEGNIILDRSMFDTTGGSSARFDENPYSPYNALPDAIMFNQNLSRFTIAPQGSQIVASKSFDDRSYKIKNALKGVNTACNYRYSWPRVSVDQGIYPAVLSLSGEYSLRCSKRELDYIVTRSYYAFYFALVEALNDMNILVGGRLKLASASDYNKLFSHKSEKLEKIISQTNKESNNLFARQIFLTLGFSRYGEHSTLNNSREALHNILYNDGVTNLDKTKIDNGSGLSRSVRTNTLFFSSLLDNAYKNFGDRWLANLSIAGVDGTVKKRFNYALNRKAWMKTGSLRNVKNIAGYVASKNRKLYTVVILCEGVSAKNRGKKLQDDIIHWLWEGNLYENKIIEATQTQKQPKVQKEEYYIQVASTLEEPDQNFLNKIMQTGYSYKIYKQKGLNKVVLGPFEGEKAQKELFSVKKMINYDAFIVKIIF